MRSAHKCIGTTCEWQFNFELNLIEDLYHGWIDFKMSKNPISMINDLMVIKLIIFNKSTKEITFVIKRTDIKRTDIERITQLMFFSLIRNILIG